MKISKEKLLQIPPKKALTQELAIPLLQRRAMLPILSKRNSKRLCLNHFRDKWYLKTRLSMKPMSKKHAAQSRRSMKT